METGAKSTAIGRLMEVISWHGSNIRNFRNFGAGIEDVLTTEVFQALDLAPRGHFLAPVLLGCEGRADEVRNQLADEAESLRVEAHADRFFLNPLSESHQEAIAVDPDVVLETPEVLALIEAKRMASSAAFQSEQLARQYFVLTREAGARRCCLILILGSEPPVKVKGRRGRIDPADAIRETLPSVYDRASNHPSTLESLLEGVEERLLWTTWQQLEATAALAATSFSSGNRSVDASVARIIQPILGSVARHSR